MAKFDLHIGDCLDVLPTLPEGIARTCVTSPPYFGLRDYGTASWDGGDLECAHRVGGQVQQTKARGAITAGVRPGVDASHCKKCGAVRVDMQIGLEDSLDDYIAKLVVVFQSVNRLLTKDGTLWLVIGDSFSNDTKWGGQSGGKNSTSALGGYQGQRVRRRGTDCDPKRGKAAVGQPISATNSGLKPKDLMMIPARVAIALQADGWYLRQDCIWAKTNCMPESVQDRPVTSHEHIFLFAKSERYYYDAEAIMEPCESSPSDIRK